MRGIAVNKRTIGVNFKENQEAVITVWSPDARQIDLVMGSEIIALKKDSFGYWSAKTNRIEAGTRYQFILNNKDRYPDPASLSQPGGVHGDSEAIDLSKFNWKDENWVPVPLEQYIIYELHTGTFSEEGNFRGIEKKLDHLIDLGVTAIEIMPVAQFPGERNWGYDGVFPFAVQHSYGGAAGLQHLVKTCHQKGLAVILDVVYNHLGPEGNYLGAFGPYFTSKYKTPWGHAINFDDAGCDAVRNYFIENALMWFRDFHIDALRLDAVHAIKDFSPVHILQEIRACTDELVKATGRKHYLLAESDLNDNRFINPVEQCGYGMDAQWDDDFHHALRVTATKERTGYYSDFSGIEDLAKAYTNAYVYDGQFSAHRKKTLGRPAGNEGKQFIVFSQNHDQVGNRMLGERTSQTVSFEMQKLLAAAVMVSPYLPLLFMGEEWGAADPFLYFVSHTDKELAEAVRRGRKEEFVAFHRQGEAPDPVVEETFLRSKLHWCQVEQGQHRVLFDYYRELIRLRKTNPVLKELNRKNVETAVNKEQETLVVTRWKGKERLDCFMNFSKEPGTMDLRVEAGKKIWDSSDRKWKGPGVSQGQCQEKGINVAAESIIIYQTHY